MITAFSKRIKERRNIRSNNSHIKNCIKSQIHIYLNLFLNLIMIFK